MRDNLFNWQQKGWPKFKYLRTALKDELAAFTKAFKTAQKALAEPQDPLYVAQTLTAEAVTTSAIEGVEVDADVVMSSICRALGVAYAPQGVRRDARSEGVAQMMLSVRDDWDAPLSSALIRKWHGKLMAGDQRDVHAGAFRVVPVRVVAINALGEAETRFEAPPPERVAEEIGQFVRIWDIKAEKPADIALKAAFIHPHFESIHPFEDGNGRVGRAIVSKILAEGFGCPLALPVSTIVARHRRAYYSEINVASHSLDWTSWAGFFIPVLTELIEEFLSAARFVAAKHYYLAKYEASFSDRARKVVMRMFEDGEHGAKAGLSAAKWSRMAKVSKPTATRDLAELARTGAVVAHGDGPMTRYYLNSPAFEPTNDPINDPINKPTGTTIISNNAKIRRIEKNAREPIDTINEPMDDTINEGINAAILRLVKNHPGRGVPFFMASIKVSRATLARAIARLVAAGRIEHRGSRKTGGYWVIEN